MNFENALFNSINYDCVNLFSDVISFTTTVKCYNFLELRSLNKLIN